MNWFYLEYIIVAVGLFLFLLIYFRIAEKFKIIDVPNHRSQHFEITLRGGGVVYPAAFLFFAVSLIFNPPSTAQNFLIFGAGLLIICIISFIDDIRSLSSRLRLVFHFIAVSLLLYFVNAFAILPYWSIPLLFIVTIGVLNSYNFMDGINGITGLYSLMNLASLLFVNEKVAHFTDSRFIIYPLLASVVFLFFNFRKKARCFMGDVGSLGIAFWILALLGFLIIKTEEIKWILFLTVYGVETVLTIIERLKLKENIFDAHRRHLYQLLANEKKIDHRLISLSYAALQLLINSLVIKLTAESWFLFAVIIISTIATYVLIKITLKENLRL